MVAVIQQEEKLEESDVGQAGIAAIICELLARPEKLKRAKRAIMGDQFLEPVVDPPLHDAIIKLDRVPTSWFSKYLLHKVRGRRSSRRRAGYVSKWLHNELRTSPAHRFPNRTYSEFEALLDAREGVQQNVDPEHGHQGVRLVPPTMCTTMWRSQASRPRE